MPSSAIRERIGRLLSSQFPSGFAVVEETFESRYYSSLLRFTISQGPEEHHLIVKLPKVTMQRGYTAVPARTKSDLALAEQEYKTLEKLKHLWRGNYSGVVKPLAFDEELGAILMPQIDSENLHQVWFSSNKTSPYEITRGLGADLADYHDRVAEPHPVDVRGLVTKIVSLTRTLEADAGCRIEGDFVPSLDRLASLVRAESLTVPGIKGFEIRNVIVDRQNRLWLIDPGRFKREAPEADLARFAVSCRMMNWGRARFPISQGALGPEIALLTGYGDIRQFDKAAFRLYSIRETLKNWLVGVRATRLKQLPKGLGGLILNLYTNSGFQRILRRTLEQ